MGYNINSNRKPAIIQSLKKHLVHAMMKESLKLKCVSLNLHLAVLISKTLAT